MPGSRTTAILTLLATLMLTGPALAAECSGMNWTESTLYMGRGLANGGGVDDEAVRGFVDDTIVPAFPEGFTVVDASGHWFSTRANRTESERTVMFVVAHPPGPDAEAALRRVADAWIERFDQSSVLRSSHPVCVWFYEKP